MNSKIMISYDRAHIMYNCVVYPNRQKVEIFELQISSELDKFCCYFIMKIV